MLVGSKRHPAVLVTITYLAGLLPVLVTDKVPTDRPESFVLVSRVGGPKLNAVTDGPMLTVQCWHPVSAEPLACAVMDALENAPGGFVDYEDDNGASQRAWISSFQEVAGPVDFPDPDVPDASRWQLTARLGIATNI